jgi:DNA-directed RNA polymerase specialized sigma24 family protein
VAEVRWPDEHLVAAAQSVGTESIAALVSGAHPHVRRFAYSLCATPEDVEDARRRR